MRRVFTDKEIKAIKNNLTILVDTREQKNQHILDYFNKKNIKYKVHKLDYGDYSCMIPSGTIEAQTQDIYFDRDIVIERKASIDEIANNFKDDGVRIKTEMAHLNKYNITSYLFVEEPTIEEATKILSKSEKEELINYLNVLKEKGIYLVPAGYDYNIRTGNYRSNYKPKSLYGRTKKGIEARYNMPIIPRRKDVMGSEIYNTLDAFVYEKFKHEGWINEECGEGELND